MNLFFRKYGEGPPLIIMHGLFGSADNWNTLAKKYGESFTTYVVDLRNHGQSPHSNDWNYELMSDDIKELILQNNIGSAHILGHSMGGKVAMFFACKYPELTQKLIVCDIAPRYYPPHHDDVLDALTGLDLESTTTRKEAEAYMETKISDFGVRQFLLKNLYWKEEKLTWRFNLSVISQQLENVGQVLPMDYQFQGPTLFIRGSKSNYIHDDDMESIHLHFPQASLLTIEGSGHWVHAEKPVEFFNATLNFL